MGLTIDMAKLGNVVDGYSGIRLTDTTMTIQSHLNRQELLRYARAINKVQMLQSLNRKDLEILDKIDALTFKYHGMCLKDSLVTRARLKACKKNRIEFIDRDGLLEHMNFMLPSGENKKKGPILNNALAQFFIEKLGKETPKKFSKIMTKLNNGQELDLADLGFLSEMQLVASQDLNWTIIHEQLIDAINEACNKLGIYFQNLQQVISHR